MKIFRRKSWFVLGGFVLYILASPLSPTACSMQSIDLNNVGSENWIREKIAIYPELNWLLSNEVEHTQEGTSGIHESSWSGKLKGSHYPEFERTIATLVNLYLIVEGSQKAFDRFIESQAPEEALTKENFYKFHQFALATIESHPEGLKAVEAELILGDMGKTPKARILAKAFSVEERDHDIFLRECMKKCPDIFPTFQKLSASLQKEFKESTGLVHFGHVTHLEGGPEMLVQLKKSEILVKDAKAFDLQMLAYMLDVSGSRAHEKNRGAKSFTNKTFLAINGMKDALSTLAEGSEVQAISKYIDFRAKLLGLQSERREDVILTRLGAMLRLFTLTEGKAIRNAWQELKKEEQEIVSQQFDPLKTRSERTPTYLPAVLVNFRESAVQQGFSIQEALNQCMKQGVVKVALFLENYRSGKLDPSISSDVTLNFNKVAGQVKNNIGIFETSVLSVDKYGNVSLISAK